MATCAEKLADAQQAYHDLVTGQMARVVVDKDGTRVEFTAANKSDLYNYIQTLLAECGPCSTAAAVNRGPAGFFF